MSKTLTSQTDLMLLLKELVQMRTVSSDHRANRDALHWFAWAVNELPLHLSEHEWNGFPSLVLTTRPTKTPKLLLLAHVDVTPAGDDLFRVKQSRGRLYGRGVFDMKFAVAAYLKLLLELGQELENYDLGVMLTTDEESSGEFGAKKLVEAGYRPQAVLVPDGANDWMIEIGAKGVCNATFTARGTAGHASRPWANPSAIDRLMNFLDDLRKQFPAEPCFDPEHKHHTMSIGIITGGEVANQVAHTASATIDFRFTPGITSDRFRRELQAVVARHPAVSAEYDMRGEVVVVKTDHPLFLEFAATVKDVLGITPGTAFSHGTSDARYFSAAGIPTIVTRGAGGHPHSDKEWTTVRAVEQFYAVLREYTGRVAKD